MVCALVAMMATVGNTVTTHSQATPVPDFKFTLIHTNDVRANHLPNATGEGGAARMATVIKQIRKEEKNTLLVDAGGRFTGTLFHQAWRGQDNAQVMDKLGYQAMGLSNPEFDLGDAGLAEFALSVSFPLIASNVNVRSGPLAGRIKEYEVITVGSEKIGVIGLLTELTYSLSKVDPATVEIRGQYEVAIEKQVATLKAQGVTKIIMFSSLGFEEDKKLAATLTDVDVIVGASSRTPMNNVLKSLPAPSDPYIPYPLATKDKAGNPLVIVHAGYDALFVGRLDLTFSDKGVIKASAGDTIYLSHYITPDRDTEQLVEALDATVKDFSNTPIKTASGQEVSASADFPYVQTECRQKECAVGNLVADALRQEMRADLAIMNMGGIRAGMKAGPITVGQVYRVVPYSNTAVKMTVTGKVVIAALENGVSRVGTDRGTGRFPQVSGLRFTYNLKAPAQKRIVSVEVQGKDGAYTPINPDANYVLATNDFMRIGGDDYVMLKEVPTALVTSTTIAVAVSDYMRVNNPLKPVLEGRITVVETDAPAAATPAK
jgi:5'-nucleotidase